MVNYSLVTKKELHYSITKAKIFNMDMYININVMTTNLLILTDYKNENITSQTVGTTL